MIWPFRPHPPLSLTHKVKMERMFRAVAIALETLPDVPPSVVLPRDIQSVLEQSDSNDMPQVLFDFIAANLPMPPQDSSPLPTVEWAMISLLSESGEPQPFQLSQNDGGQITKVQFDRSLSESPDRMASICVRIACGCWFRSLDTDRSSSLQGISPELLASFFGLTPMLSCVSDRIYGGPENAVASELAMSDNVYAMAMAEYSLGIEYSQMVSWFRPDAARELKAGLKFLHKTGDCVIPNPLSGQVAMSIEGSNLSEIVQEQDLAGDQESICLSRLMDLALSRRCPKNLQPLVCGLLGHRESEIRRWAAATLQHAEQLDDDQLTDIFAAVDDSVVSVRAQAVLALRSGFARDEDVVERLSDFLSRPERLLVESSVRKLAEYSEFPDRLTSQLLKAIHTMAVKGSSDEMLGQGVSLLGKVCEQPEQLIRERFADDPTVYSMLLGSGEDLEPSGEA